MMAVENAANRAAKDISFLPMKSMNVSANYRRPLSSLLSDIEHFIPHCRSQRRPLCTLSPSVRVNVADLNSFRLLRFDQTWRRRSSLLSTQVRKVFIVCTDGPVGRRAVGVLRALVEHRG